jgi:Flp pilus assembly pilin Flp
MIKRRAHLLRDKAGTVSIEYALIVTIISIIAISSMISIGGSVNGYITSAYNGLVR